MKLNLVSIDPAGFVRLAADGTITSADLSTQGPHPLQVVVGDQWSHHRVLLDLDKVTFIDSSAIGWLIETNKAFKANGGRLIVHSIHPKVRQVLDLLHVGKAVTLADNESAAKDLLLGAAQ